MKPEFTTKRIRKITVKATGWDHESVRTFEAETPAEAMEMMMAELGISIEVTSQRVEEIQVRA